MSTVHAMRGSINHVGQFKFSAKKQQHLRLNFRARRYDDHRIDSCVNLILPVRVRLDTLLPL